MVGRAIACELLLVDDDSDEDTPVVSARLACPLSVHIEVRRGARPDLYRSALKGIARNRFDRIVGDGPPPVASARIPDLFAGLDAGCDTVVGGRNVPCASTPAIGWRDLHDRRRFEPCVASLRRLGPRNG